LGNLEHPLDICSTVGVNGAGYVYRGTSFDDGLVDRMAEAIRRPGFALLDIWDLCTAYFAPKNKMGKKGLEQTIAELGFTKGVLYERGTQEYATAYREAAGKLGERVAPRPIPVEFTSDLDGSLSVVVAGSAGAKVRSAARVYGEAAIRSGLWVTQRDDYPVTVKTGHSVSQVVLTREEMPPVAVTIPNVVVLVSGDGLRKVGGMLEAMDSDQLVVTVPEFSDVKTGAELVAIDLAAWDERVPKRQLALILLAAAAVRTAVVPLEALRAAAAGPFEAENLSAIEAGAALA
jgi:Pyruvate/2-oxoacid:ferredoxin oxidoreductase gamma subunit